MLPWVTHNDFKTIVTRGWNKGSTFIDSIKKFQEEATVWNRDVFGFIGKKERILQARFNGIQRALDIRPSGRLKEIEASLLKEFEEILTHEELLWFQKSRSDWIKFKDRNTKYFHDKTKARHHRNRIEMLKINGSKWETDETKLRLVATEFFNELYTSEDGVLPDYNVRNKFPPLSDWDFRILGEAISKEEAREAVFEMSPNKAAGSDGLLAFFYQSQWEIIGDDVCSLV